MYEIDFTTLNRLKAYLKIRPEVVQEDDTLRGLIRAGSLAITDILDRNILLKQRTEYFDIENDQRTLWLRGWPIKRDPVTGDLLMQIKNDISLPPTWTDAPLTVDQDYIVYPDEYELGRVRFHSYILDGGARALQIVSTAGMATKTSVEGATGQCMDPGGGLPHRFTDINASFIGDNIMPDTLLQITDNKNSRAGLYSITNILSDTELEITTLWPGALPGPADEIYIIQGAGFIGLYPSIELACQKQVAYWYKKKETPEVVSIANAGGNVTYMQTRPIDVKLYRAQAITPEALLLIRPYMQPETVFTYG